MTNTLYLNDTYLFTSQATIMSIAADERGPFLVLNQTIFYPQGGGQPSDHGLIKGDGIEVQVSNVRYAEKEIRHYINCDVDKRWIAASVSCSIDQERRILNSKYHTAGHLIGNVVEVIYPGLKAVKGHSFPKEAYIEFMGVAMPDSIIISDALKEALLANLSISTFEISIGEFEERYYKLPYEIGGNKAFRAMQIGKYTPVPCGGTHLRNISEISDIKICKISVKNDRIKIAYEVK